MLSRADLAPDKVSGRQSSLLSSVADSGTNWCVMTRHGNGWGVNHKRVYRLYRKEELGVRTKKRKKRAANLRVVPELPTAPNQRWCMDFVYDRLEDGHYFRTLNVVDVFTRECLAIHADRKLSGAVVAKVLEATLGS